MSVQGLRLQDINKSFAGVEALGNINLDIQSGEFFTLLGPSGCGKTTLLRIIAGFEIPDRGQVLLHGQDISQKSAMQRPVNTVFQSYALFPHLNVYENVAFGLRSKRVSGPEVDRRVKNALEMLRLTEFAQRHSHQMSGGQQQRVALARALVNEPEVLLLDEPLSALDAKLRTEVQVELRRLQHQLGTTFILVTHDQDEAMSVSDRIAVMRRGAVEQVGVPREVYATPKSRFVAEFLGLANVIQAKIEQKTATTAFGRLQLDSIPAWKDGMLVIRPERVQLCEDPPLVNTFPSKVRDVVYRGSYLEVWLDREDLRVRTPPHQHLSVGQDIYVHFPAEALVPLEVTS
ncbi:ABC transporter ATP-binding protein [Deinococcus roseus]|uniref:Spermidine/putrescine import ATP-binding protein PotA n=1 Tax=Deinococcus roseus TaxID=392414 RepID=A0ABQ2CYQ9_9DEIO|nr:ABC transporter ATP-binding protein [Deinococcus roseus]GGJ29960.1 spermidine/putrescine import ATP-binding protein PotA [Deinococcus roseus]